ncbi:MAG: DNA-directed RNA polymerase subunit alpha [Acidobacteria bacterium]|nr:DNA-directed RNA polymerase subunit alpha [Acidobacteriota bacterium]
MLWKGFQRPKRVEIDTETLTDTYGKFSAQPFERGFGATVGNALRRSLLAAIEGAAITAVRIDGALHEFSSLEGVVEDTTDIILNLKQVPLRSFDDTTRVITLDVTGPREVTAGDFNGDASVEIRDPNSRVATLNERGRLRLEAQVKNGRGYVGADRNLDESMGIGWIPLDSVHSPVKRVNYRVEAARLGRTTDFERLVFEVWTDGTVTPEEAVSRAGTLLRDHLTIFIDAEESLVVEVAAEEEVDGGDISALLLKEIDDLNLSVRSANCLRNANINTVGDLVVRSEKEMLETKNFGRKSLEEIQKVLDRMGLTFGMELPENAESGVQA